MTKNPEITKIFNTLWGTEPDGAPKIRTALAVDYTESIQDGLQVYHNPYAKYPISPEIFRKEGVVQVFADPDTKELTWEGESNCLMYRLANSLRFSENKSYRDRNAPHRAALPHHRTYGSVYGDSADQSKVGCE